MEEDLLSAKITIYGKNQHKTDMENSFALKIILQSIYILSHSAYIGNWKIARNEA